MVKHKKKTHPRHKLMIIMVIIAIAIAAVSLVLVLIFSHRGPNCSGLVGTWVYSGTEYEGDYSLTFHSNGTATSREGETTYDFTYLDHSDAFELFGEDTTLSASFPYAISDDNTTFTMQDSDGHEVVYSCK